MRAFSQISPKSLNSLKMLVFVANKELQRFLSGAKIVVETVGIEPTSKNISGKLSTCLAGYLISPDGRHTADSHQTIPFGPLTLTGGHARGFLHS